MMHRLNRRNVLIAVVTTAVIGGAGYVLYRQATKSWKRKEQPRELSRPANPLFDEAVAFINSSKHLQLSDEVKLRLYALYKQATMGPCAVPPPPLYDLVGRAKWDAWKSLGQLIASEAAEQYVALVASIKGQGSSGEEKTEAGGPARSSQGMGHAVSRMARDEFTHEGPHDLAYWIQQKNDEEALKCIQNQADVDERDEEGRTGLMWACDMERMVIVQEMLQRNANVNAKDNDGLTPLHYAATSGNEAIIDLLLMRGADVTQKDNDGQTPADCADAAHIREKLEMHRSLVMQSVQENNEMEKEKEPKGAESQSENDDEEEKQDS